MEFVVDTDIIMEGMVASETIVETVMGTDAVVGIFRTLTLTLSQQLQWRLLWSQRLRWRPG
jgi:hypothetical protein